MRILSEYITLDNTCAAIASEVGITKIPAKIHDATSKLLSSMEGRFGSSKTWGEAVEFRTSNQTPVLPKEGTITPPKLLINKPKN